MEVPESTVRRVGYVGEVFFNHLSDGLVFLPLVRLGMGAGLFHLLMVLDFLNLWLGWGLVKFSPSSEQDLPLDLNSWSSLRACLYFHGIPYIGDANEEG